MIYSPQADDIPPLADDMQFAGRIDDISQRVLVALHRKEYIQRFAVTNKILPIGQESVGSFFLPRRKNFKSREGKNDKTYVCGVLCGVHAFAFRGVFRAVRFLFSGALRLGLFVVARLRASFVK